MHCLAEISEKMIGEIIVYASFIFTGAIFVGLSIPLVLKKVPPNQLYGWRTPKAFQSKDIWYKINHYSGRDMLVIGIIQLLFNLALFLFRSNLAETIFYLLVPGNLLILISGTIIMLIRGLLYLKKL